jgi:hypothetical protein
MGLKGLAHKKNGNTTQKSGNSTQKKNLQKLRVFYSIYLFLESRNFCVFFCVFA